MQVPDDGSHVQLAPEKRFHDAVAHLVQPERLLRLTQKQAEVLAIVVMDGMATWRRIEEVRGRGAAVDRAGRAGLAAPGQLGDGGPAALPEGCSAPSGTIVRPVGPWFIGLRRGCSS